MLLVLGLLQNTLETELFFLEHFLTQKISQEVGSPSQNILRYLLSISTWGNQSRINGAGSGHLGSIGK